MNFDIIDQYESFVTNNFIIKDKNQIKHEKYNFKGRRRFLQF